MEKRLTKENYYLDMAEASAGRGTCLRRNYGAVIVKNDEVVSTGYTGAPRGRKNCCDIGKCLRQELDIPSGQRYELCRSVHAEANAIHSVNVLGNNLSVRNGMAVSIVAINIETGNQFKFNCIADCARAIKEKLNLYTNERYIQSSINRVLIGERKSYHKYIFKYI